MLCDDDPAALPGGMTATRQGMHRVPGTLMHTNTMDALNRFDMAAALQEASVRAQVRLGCVRRGLVDDHTWHPAPGTQTLEQHLSILPNRAGHTAAPLPLPPHACHLAAAHKHHVHDTRR